MTNVDIWIDAVERFLRHVSDAWVEKSLLYAMSINENDTTKAVDWMVSNGYGSLIGAFGSGGPSMTSIDVGTDCRAPDFIKVFDKDWTSPITVIPLKDILDYLKSNKNQKMIEERMGIQLTLF